MSKDALLREFGAAVALHTKLAAEENSDNPENTENAEKDENSSADEGRRRKARARAVDLLPMKGFGRGVADYMLPASFGGTRAGRAAMIAKAMGKDPGFTVKYPMTSSVLGAYAGLGGGMGLGALGGAGLGALAHALGGSTDNLESAMAGGAALGTGLGGLAGTLGGVYATGSRRRENMRKVRSDFAKELEEHGTSRLNLDSPRFGVLSSLLLPFAGAHRAGQADAYRALKDNERYPKTTGRTLAYLSDHIPYTSYVTSPLRGIVQNFNARARTAPPRLPKAGDDYGPDEFESAPKFASAFEFGQKAANAMLHGGLGGAALGAGLGGLSGLIAPGYDEETDEEGYIKRKPRSRLSAMLSGIAKGGLGGAAAGGALGHFRPDLATQAMGKLQELRPTREKLTGLYNQGVIGAHNAAGGVQEFLSKMRPYGVEGGQVGPPMPPG